MPLILPLSISSLIHSLIFISLTDKGEQLVWNQPSFHDFRYEAFYIHWQNLALKLNSVFMERFPKVATTLAAMMVSLYQGCLLSHCQYQVEVVFDELKDGVFKK